MADPQWWTPEMQAQAIAQRNAGIIWADIADAIGAPSGKAVWHRMKKAGHLGRVVAKKTYVKAPPATAAGWPKTKTCLKCRKTFSSTGPHNHLCPTCRGEVLNYGGDLETLYGG